MLNETLLKMIARWGLTLMVVVLLFVISAMPLDIIGMDGIRPSFMLIAIYYLTLLRPDIMSFLLVFMIGIVLDLQSSYPLGLNAFILVTVQWLVRSQRKFLIGQPFMMVWAGFSIVALVSGVIQLIIVSLFNAALFSPVPVLVSVILSSALFPLLAVPLSAVHRSLEDEKA